MNKIVIVGHPTSGYREVEALLHQSGMRPPLPSRREGLLPQDITATLCKAHKTPPLDAVMDEGEITQIQAGPVWHGMALDLMLGNLDQELWGWADPQTLFALDYWKDLDPKLSFVLVYDEPHRALMDGQPEAGAAAPKDGVQRRLNNWAACNGALLSFFLRNPQRCLLVHAQQVRLAADSYVQKLQPLLDAPLKPQPTPAAKAPERAPQADAAGETLLPAQIAELANLEGADVQQLRTTLHAEAAERYLVGSVLAEHPACLQLYAELQSAATLPLQAGAQASGGQAAFAWEAMLRQRQLLATLFTGMKQAVERLQLVQQQQAPALPDAKVKEITQENDLLLSQLHQVQEELERYYLENQRLKQKVPPPKPAGPYGAADRIKRQLSYRLGTVMIQRSRSLGGWFGMPWALAAEAKAFRADLAQRQADKKAPPIHKYRDAHEAERVKQHLSYRLGSTLLAHAKSPIGWVKLPFALARQVRQFRGQRHGG
jgi:hypothetical protein